jgi:hypothetical protein
MGLKIKAKSENYVLHKLSDEIIILNTLVKNIYEKQCIKAEINKKIIRGIKEHGHKYLDKLNIKKKQIETIIIDQQEMIKEVGLIIKKIQQHITLLIHMEQISLAIHTNVKQDDLSDMIDVHTMPIEKFNKEIEHIKMLKSSFDILKVELEKQKGYIKAFDFDENTQEEHYFFESEKQESELSEEEIISVSQLKNFCDDLHLMIKERLGSKVPFFSDSDEAARIITDELKKIKITNSFFPMSIYTFVNKLITKNVHSKNVNNLVVFLIFFLLSRLKKYKIKSYYSQLRTTILCYNLLNHLNIKSNEKLIIAGATLIANFPELNMTNIPDDNDELQIVKNYYQTVNQLFNEELSFVNTLITEYRKTNIDENETVSLPWITEGAKLMRLIYHFDEELMKFQYLPSEIEQHKNEIFEKLTTKHGGCQKEIAFLLTEWPNLVPKELTLFS